MRGDLIEELDLATSSRDAIGISIFLPSVIVRVELPMNRIPADSFCGALHSVDSTVNVGQPREEP